MRWSGVEVHEVVPERPELLAALKVVRDETFVSVVNAGDPPIPLEELATDVFRRTTQVHFRSWVAFVDGEPAGEATFELEDAEENLHLASSDWVAVRPDFRRRGVARAMLGRVLDALADDDRTWLMLWSPVLSPDAGGEFARSLGLTVGSEERCSRVRRGDLDEGLLAKWRVEGRDRVDGYRLVRFADRCPDEYLDAYLEATVAMDDMPTDDLRWTVAPTDSALVRSREEVWEAKSLIVARTLALDADGHGAGFSELFVSRHRPSIAYQGDTGVAPEHRGHGLGRWLKAENLRFLEEQAPGFEVIETYNAQSNPWMLDINVAMGFRPHVVYRGFQGDLAEARARLGD